MGVLAATAALACGGASPTTAPSTPERAAPTAASPAQPAPQPAATATPTALVLPEPAPPQEGPIAGVKVSLGVARELTPYTIPTPTEGTDGAELLEVWVSHEDRQQMIHEVYLVYSSGLEIHLEGKPGRIDYGSLIKPPLIVAATVKGVSARGKDSSVRPLDVGGDVYWDTRANVSWWVNGVAIRLYHPMLSIEQLLEIAESMPNPVWDYRKGEVGGTVSGLYLESSVARQWRSAFPSFVSRRYDVN